MNDRRAPPLPLLAREATAFAALRILGSLGPTVRIEQPPKPQKILVIPGFMASDATTGRLRRSLNQAGYNSHGWGLGRNFGITHDMLGRLDARIDGIAKTAQDDDPAIVVGWSLGGLVAREYAKMAPEKVAMVITLGSPFSGDIRGNNAWRFYELVAGHPVDQPPIAADLRQKPPVPTIAFWSSKDGVVSAASARGEPGEADHQVELDCTHMAFATQAKAIRAIADSIAKTIAQFERP